MMSNHSMLVEDLKSKSGANRQNKRRSIYSGVDNPAAVGINASIDKVSVDTLAHEIDAYGKTLEKQSAAGKPTAAVAGAWDVGYNEEKKRSAAAEDDEIPVVAKKKIKGAAGEEDSQSDLIVLLLLASRQEYGRRLKKKRRLMYI